MTKRRIPGGASPIEGEAFVSKVAEALFEAKADGIVALDVRGLTDVMDFVLMATSLSERQLRSLRDRAIDAVEAQGRRIIGASGEGDDGWIVVDTGDLVCHLMTAEARSYYDIEGLWSDARVVDLKLDGGR